MTSRASYLGPDQARRLEHFATSVDIMFPENIGIIHVGSSIERANYRDVDVRVVMGNKNLRRLATAVNLLDLNMLLSGWGRTVTGLPIDCQVQSLSESATHEGTREGLTGMARYRLPIDAAIDGDHPHVSVGEQ